MCKCNGMDPTSALPECMEIYFLLDTANFDDGRRIPMMGAPSSNDASLTPRSSISSFLNAGRYENVASVRRQFDKTATLASASTANDGPFIQSLEHVDAIDITWPTSACIEFYGPHSFQRQVQRSSMHHHSCIDGFNSCVPLNLARARQPNWGNRGRRQNTGAREPTGPKGRMYRDDSLELKATLACIRFVWFRHSNNNQYH